MLRLTFDGGTLVLSGIGPPQVDCAEAGLPAALVWDPRIDQYRAPAYRYREVARWLKRNESAANEVFLQRARTELWTAPDLRDYQHAALLSWFTAARTGVVVLPTGAGKTRLACAAMAAARCSVLCLGRAYWRRDETIDEDVLTMVPAKERSVLIDTLCEIVRRHGPTRIPTE
jgi:Xeroderma pigmentosum group B helicase damage recognition domain